MYSKPGSGSCSVVFIGVEGKYLLALSIGMAAIILLSFGVSRAPWTVLGFVFFPALDVVRCVCLCFLCGESAFSQ